MSILRRARDLLPAQPARDRPWPGGRTEVARRRTATATPPLTTRPVKRQLGKRVTTLSSFSGSATPRPASGSPVAPATPEILTPAQIADFHRDGFVVIRGFYNAAQEIRPIQQDIYEIIGMVIEKHQLPIARPAFAPETFDAGYQELIAHNRALGGEIYDAVKQIPGFLRLTCNIRHDALFRDLRPGALPGVAAGGYGIRIDNPSEERFRADWHQDYPGQFRSLDGLTLWSPLVPVEASMGPVIFCIGSHKEGLFKLHSKDPNNPNKTGAYGLYLHDRDTLISRYPQVAPLTSPGDLVVLDYQVLHASGYNVGKRSRWSMQMRYFNFREPFGIKIGWKGSFAAGVAFRDIHPELLVD